MLYRLTDAAVEILDVDGAGVSVDDNGRLRFVTATDDRVVAVEREQVDGADGPCHEAHASGDRVTSAHLATENRWPRYVDFAVQQGCCAVAGIPMRAGDDTIGALNLYRYSPAEWPGERAGSRPGPRGHGIGYIVYARTLSATRELAQQLQTALDSRIVVEQANGILAERRGETPAPAFTPCAATPAQRAARRRTCGRRRNAHLLTQLRSGPGFRR